MTTPQYIIFAAACVSVWMLTFAAVLAVINWIDFNLWLRKRTPR